MEDRLPLSLLKPPTHSPYRETLSQGLTSSNSQGRLERLAFNGTANLPFSPLTFAIEDELMTNLPWWEIGHDNGHHLAFPHPLEDDFGTLHSTLHSTPHGWSMAMNDDEASLNRVLTSYQPEWYYNEPQPPE
jgi:hypothetical protein